MKKLLVIFALIAGGARAYQPDTHFELSSAAADRSHVDQILRDRFGEVFGLDQLVFGIGARNWIAAGGYLEDVPAIRGINHFHEPLSPWEFAGLLGSPSSIRWQQTTLGQGLGGTWTWARARGDYATYLLSPSAEDRDRALANVLRGIGQLGHLVQDATSPAHTRRDPHLIYDGYEQRIDDLRVAAPLLFLKLIQGDPIFPDPAIFTPTNNTGAPSRIARLIDTDTFGGDANSYNTGTLIGASEYTNGGFVSDDTIFKDFDLPRKSSLAPDGFLDKPLTSLSADKRRYFVKVGDGDIVTHFVAEGTLWEKLQFSFFTAAYILDDWTYFDAASLLMRRAIGYSAALYDYFFREQLEITAPSRFVYAKARYSPDHPETGFGQFSKLKARIRNKLADEALNAGTLTAVVRYRLLAGSGGIGGTDSFKEPDAGITVAYQQVTAAPVSVPGVGTSPTEYDFDFSANPIPVNAVDVRLLVVFQGASAEEQSVVAVGIKDLAEPDPVDYVNATDWECFEGQLFHVADPFFDTLSNRDVNNDKVVDLFGPFKVFGLHVKTNPIPEAVVPTDANFDMRVASIDGYKDPQTARVVILQDQAQEFYANVVEWDEVRDFITAEFRPPEGFGFRSIVNHVIQVPGIGPAHEYTANFTYRGQQHFHDVTFVTAATVECFDRTADLPPDGTFLDATQEEISP